MSQAHMVELPKFYWGMKIAQLVLAVIVFALSCYEVAIYASSWAGFTVFTVRSLLPPHFLAGS